jgi:hypothetical protein
MNQTTSLLHTYEEQLFVREKPFFVVVNFEERISLWERIEMLNGEVSSPFMTDLGS